MRTVGAVAGLFLLVACNALSHSTNLSERSPDAMSAVSPGDATFLDVPFGPDPPPMACAADAANPCPAPPTACTDGGAFVVGYGDGQCVSGSCVWQKYNVDCATLGGTCADLATVDGAMSDGEPDGPAAPDGSVWVTVNGCVTPAPAGPDPPVTPCDGEAGAEGGLCPPPPSVCGDSSWLVYYDDGECVAGQCVWKKEHTTCFGVGCSNGSCHYLGTSAAAPN